MSFILVAVNGEEFQVNGWNWRTVLRLLSSEALISPQLPKRMGANGCSAVTVEAFALRFACAIDKTIERMTPAERLRADLSITGTERPALVFTPDGILDHAVLRDLYSIDRESLERLRGFLERSGGFTVL